MKKAQNKEELFAQKMCNVLNYGALNLAIGIGYESGLFESLSGFNTPSSCLEIAERSGLDERYVYEWLGVMASGEIVEASFGVDGDELFFLPKEYAPFLCRSGGNSNMAVYTQEIPLLTECAKRGVLNGMRTGEGIPYSRYPEFYSFMEELAEAKHRKVLVDIFLPSVQGGRILELLRKGIAVCDIGCAEGVVLELMARAFPRSEFTGIDISEESIAKARARVASLGLTNVKFEIMDVAADNISPAKFDYIMAFDSIHDQTEPFKALQNIRSMLKDHGVFSMIDIAAESQVSGNVKHPMGPFLYTVSLMHCMPVGLQNGGAGLGMMWGREQAISLCRKAGFKTVEVHSIPEDGFNYHYLCSK